MSDADGLGLHVLDGIGRIAACPSHEALARTAATECARAGIDAVSSAMVTGPFDNGSDRFHFTTWPPGWAQAYRANRWADLDPAVRHALRSGAPIGWSELGRSLPRDDPGHALFRAAAALGYADGLVTPVRSARGRLGVVCAVTRMAVLPGGHRDYLHALCTAILHRAEALAEPDGAAEADAPEAEPIPPLSARERECVRLMLAGHTDREIATRLGISVSTARFHVDNARVKAGARSRVHLAATASRWF